MEMEKQKQFSVQGLRVPGFKNQRDWFTLAKEIIKSQLFMWKTLYRWSRKCTKASQKFSTSLQLIIHKIELKDTLLKVSLLELVQDLLKVSLENKIEYQRQITHLTYLVDSLVR